MASSMTLGRAQLIFAFCLPLAILVGYLLSDPLDPSSGLFVLLAVGILSIPLLMYGYHPALVCCWNAAITPAFLPGEPFLWVPLSALGLCFAVLNRFTSAHVRFLSVRSITAPLVFLFGVVAATAFFRGGFGLRSFGSETYGGRNYVYIFAAILGYFALASQRIPKNRADLFAGMFFLSGLTGLIPNLAFWGGRSWYFLYYLFPPLYATEQAMETSSINVRYVRVFGLTAASLALFCWLLARFGLKRTLSLAKPLPFLLLVLSMLGCVFTGFRTMLVIFCLLFAVQFCLEGLLRWKTVVPLFAAALLLAIGVIPNADKLPLVVQRTLSVLPIRLSPVAEMSAEGSTEWRIQMWQELLPEVPQYLLKGKGFAIDPTDLALATFNNRFNLGYSGSMAAGDYHSGPLSLVIPLGIWGVIGFVWFCWTALRYLYKQYRYGDRDLLRINTFLLAYFIVRLFVFIFVFGGFFSDLCIFTGVVGLSVSLNGVSAPQPVPGDAQSASEVQDYQPELSTSHAH